MYQGDELPEPKSMLQVRNTLVTIVIYASYIRLLYS